MQSQHDTKTTITLVLTEREAEWLKNLMQNPICSIQICAATADEENPIDKQFRSLFWDALTSDMGD